MGLSTKKARKSIGVLLFCLIFTLLFTACSKEADTTESPSTESKVSNTEQGTEEKPEAVETKNFSNEEVVLKVATPWGEEGFMDRIGKYVEEALPHITFEHVDYNGTSQQLQENNAKNIVPDILLAYTGQQPLIDLDMVFPLDEMIQQYNVDISGIEPTLLADIRSRDEQGRLIGLPAESSPLALYYNKDIFDMFGITYPTDSMTWEEVFDLAKKTTGTRDGVQYVGLEFGTGNTELADVPLMQLSMNMTDPQTGEVLLTKDPNFTEYMDLMKKFYSIPGIYEPGDEASGKNMFMDKQAAMEINWWGYLSWFPGENEEKLETIRNMDTLPVPSWSDKKDMSPPMGTHPWVINNSSDKKEAALQVLQYITSKDYQKIFSKKGIPPIYIDQEFLKDYAVEHVLSEKNNLAYFQHPFAEPPARKSMWDSQVDLIGSMPKFAESDMNVSEFIRKLSEESEAKIKTLREQKK
ncbi:ABC transporter substrate-binding protein [Paenibacillus dokdonensis]|uniref:ABC transporter substrate-binding protein n=1 Tax=Paenibacillus dokdonensis TaxID=2567944 RepID=UPI0010A75738|nr:extracellular solute-binding protein [Paenibacillus dokdonensis]